VIRPTVDVEARSGLFGATTKALIDTGAPRCVFPKGIARLLGITLPAIPSQTTGKHVFLNREWHSITCDVDLSIRPFDDIAWNAGVDFVIEEGLPFALLGYEGFLNKWAVGFNAALGYFTVEEPDDFYGKTDASTKQDLRRRPPDIFPSGWF
jgi:hypothetical protein